MEPVKAVIQQRPSGSFMQDPLFAPKLLTVLKQGVDKSQLLKDITAGIIVGIVALPLAIAFAIASGVSPDKGLITAIVAGLLISALGGSRVQIGGPTGAFIVIVYAIVQEHGVHGLILATFLAGFILIAMGLIRMGALLKYIPYPLIVGFTSGIAVIIFSSQIKELMGMSIPQLPADFLEKWSLYAHHFNQINGNAVAIGIGSIAITVAFNHLFPKIPGSLIAILLTTLAVHFLHLPVNTIETAFGKIPNHLPAPALPHVDFESIQALLQPAFAIALLGAIESLLSAVVADGMIGGRHRSNTELIAQGIANISSALFGGIPATGAIARTATNVKNGGRTPIAGITHALTLLLIMLLLAPLAGLIPLACLAGILTVVAYHMSEWRQFVSLLRGNKYDVILLLVTFFLTIFFDLVIAIEIGIVLASFALMRRLSESVSIQNASVLFNNESDNGEQLFDEELPKLPAGVIVYEIRGPLFFGAAQTFRETLAIIDSKPRVIIFRMRHVPFIDATGIYRLKEVIRQLHAQRIHVVLSGVNAQVKEELEKGGLYSVLQREFLLDNITAALHKAQALLHAS